MTTIGTNEMTNFFISKVHGTSISIEDAKNLGLDVNKLDAADTDKDGRLTPDEIELDKDLFADFASIVLDEKEKGVDIDKEKEKEKESQVKDKDGAGVK